MKRIIALLGWVGIALVVAAVVLLAVRPDLVDLRRGLAFGGLGVTVLYALTQWRDIARSVSGRGVKYGSITATSVVLVLAILVGLNWISSRQNKRWDLTATNRFSLSEQTQQILRGLDSPVTFRIFHVGPPTEYRERLAEYGYYSSQVKTEFVDVDRDPISAQKYEVTLVPTILIEHAGRTERAQAGDEQTLTNALKRVIEGAPKKVYFVQGHGERDPGSSDTTGYATVAGALRNDNFDVAPLTLAQQTSVPADATVLVIAGPKTDLLPAELDAIRAFLSRGGKLSILLDPPDKGTSPDIQGLVALARDWGIDVGNNVVLDASGMGQQIGTGPEVPIAMPTSHPITSKFRMMTAFPIARSVTPIEGGTSGHVAQRVLETSPQSWAETDVTGLWATGRPERNVDRGDIAGPVSIAAAVSAAAETAAAPDAGDAPKPETRLVVVGDSDFVANNAVGLPLNSEVFLNMMNWLAQQEDLIAIRPADPGSSPIALSQGQNVTIFWFAIFIFPALLVANAVRIWWRKR